MMLPEPFQSLATDSARAQREGGAFPKEPGLRCILVEQIGEAAEVA
jgi:hypothetical protein